MVWICLLCIAVISGFYFYRENNDSVLVSKLLVKIDSLQEDNRALTEALVRSEGRPLVFRKPVHRDGDSYFDYVRPDNGDTR